MPLPSRASPLKIQPHHFARTGHFTSGITAGIKKKLALKTWIMLNNLSYIFGLAKPRPLGLVGAKSSPLQMRLLKIRFCENLLGWERKPRVWLGQVGIRISNFAVAKQKNARLESS